MRLIKCQKCGKTVEASGEECFCPECRMEMKKASTLKDRTCKACGAQFIGGPRAWYCPECRKERQKEQNREHKRRGTSRPLGSVDLCKVCGKEYIVESGRQMYCKDCAKNAVRMVDRAQSIAYNRENKDRLATIKKDRQENRRVCQVCGKVFYSEQPTVTCSDFCNRCMKSYNQAMADYRRGRRDMPTMEEIVKYQSRQSGVNGVSRSKNGKRWIAHVRGKHIGTYDTIEEAARAVKEAEQNELDQSNA